MAKKIDKINLNLSNETKSFTERIDEIRTLIEENLRYTKNLHNLSQRGSEELKNQKELQRLLQENLKISNQLYEMTRRINRWVVWQRIMGVVKILIIVIPIILGIIYLPPLIKQVIQPYTELFDFSKNTNNQDLLQQVKSMIKLEQNEETATEIQGKITE